MSRGGVGAMMVDDMKTAIGRKREALEIKRQARMAGAEGEAAHARFARLFSRKERKLCIRKAKTRLHAVDQRRAREGYNVDLLARDAADPQAFCDRVRRKAAIVLDASQALLGDIGHRRAIDDEARGSVVAECQAEDFHAAAAAGGPIIGMERTREVARICETRDGE